MMQQTRPPAVAGLFYPASADELRQDVQTLLAAAAAEGNKTSLPKVLIAPHAGYIYSGAIAASAYACLAGVAGSIIRVVLLGPAHRVHVDALALPAATLFETPLGSVAIDTGAVAELADLPQVVVSDEVHAQEHSLEVQLPFLQQVLGSFQLVPLAVGHVSAEQVAQVLDRLWGGDETLIVISTDLSHYLPYASACASDEFTAETILQLQPNIHHQQACGATPVNGLLIAARKRRLEPQLLDLRNSGDTAGDKSRVVGYASFAFHERPDRH